MQKTLSEIRRRCLFRLKEKYNDRLDSELDWFSDNGGADALLLMSNFARHLKARGVFIGAGHGKECCSLACWGLGVTNINPVEWDLTFDTFAEEFRNDRSLFISTSQGGAAELGSLPQLTDFPEGVSIADNGSATVQFLSDDMCPECTFIVTEEPELDLLKVFQDKITSNIYGLRLDAKTLDGIKEEGFVGFSLLARTNIAPLMKDLRPECFSDLCLLYPLSKAIMENVCRKMCEVRKSGLVHSIGNVSGDRILAESYGVPVYAEQVSALRRLGIAIPINMQPEDEMAYPSKATAVAVTLEAVIAKTFRMRMAELYEETYALLREGIQERVF